MLCLSGFELYIFSLGAPDLKLRDNIQLCIYEQSFKQIAKIQFNIKMKTSRISRP